MGRNPGGSARLYFKSLVEGEHQSGLTDGQLLERFTTGNPDSSSLAFAGLVERHGPMVLRTCRGILRDEHEAMDAYQATFLVLVLKSRSLWVLESAGPWLHRVACRAARRLRTGARRRREMERTLFGRIAAGRPAGPPDGLVAAMHEVLDRLPERQRVPMILCDLEGLTCEAAARRVGCPIGTLASRLSRGRELLRVGLIRRGYAPSIAVSFADHACEFGGSTVPRSLAESVAALVGGGADGLGTVSGSSIQIARSVARSMIMAKMMSACAITAVALGLCATSTWTLRPGLGSQRPDGTSPDVKAGATEKNARPEAKVRVLAAGENLHGPGNVDNRWEGGRESDLFRVPAPPQPLHRDEAGPIGPESRQAIVYLDGSVKLWKYHGPNSVLATLRHDEPIRSFGFVADVGLLLTTSDHTVKSWDALTGAPRKVLAGQTAPWLNPALPISGRRFVTTSPGLKGLTIWDGRSMEPVATFPSMSLEIRDRPIPSRDGKTLAVFRSDPAFSAELIDLRSKSSFATLREPCAALAEFDHGGYSSNYLTDSGRFWSVARLLSPPHEDAED
ncbi:sigma-70 family RNA polymerase sigma factor [Isosphaeraceae bacterium EP7]